MNRRSLLRVGAGVGTFLLAGCSQLTGGESNSEPETPTEASKAGLRMEGSWSAGVRSVEATDGTLEVEYEMETEGINGNHHEAERRASATALNVLSSVAEVGLGERSGLTVIAFVTTQGNSPFPAHQVSATAETVTSVDWSSVAPGKLWDHVDDYDFESAPF